jgi:hypothetical protein
MAGAAMTILWEPQTLAAELGVTLPDPINTATGGATAGGSAPAAEPLNLDHYPTVRAALDTNTGDRSEDTMRVLGACFDDGLTYAQACGVVHQRPDLADRLADRNDDDLQRCWNKVVDKRQSIKFVDPGAISRPANCAEPQDKPGEPGAYQFVDGASFILDIPQDIPALWGHGSDVLWAEGESLMIAGPMGLGKTTLAGLLIRAQLRVFDNNVLGLPVTPRAGKILYLAMDRPAQIARAFARQFTEDDRDALRDRLVVWKGPPPADVAKRPTLLLELAEAAGAGTVYLDSVKDAAIGLSDDEVGAGYNRARQYLLAQNKQLCEQHHTVKRGANGGAPTTAADVYGSAWITSGTGSIVLFSGDPGDPIVGFRHIRQPAHEVGPYRLLHDQDTGALTIDHNVDLVEYAKAAGPEGITAKAAAAALYDTDKPTEAQVQKARNRLNKLVDEGLLVRHEGQRGGGKQRTPAVWFAS